MNYNSSNALPLIPNSMFQNLLHNKYQANNNKQNTNLQTPFSPSTMTSKSMDIEDSLAFWSEPQTIDSIQSTYPIGDNIIDEAHSNVKINNSLCSNEAKFTEYDKKPLRHVSSDIFDERYSSNGKF